MCERFGRQRGVPATATEAPGSRLLRLPLELSRGGRGWASSGAAPAPPSADTRRVGSAGKLASPDGPTLIPRVREQQNGHARKLREHRFRRQRKRAIFVFDCLPSTHRADHELEASPLPIFCLAFLPRVVNQ